MLQSNGLHKHKEAFIETQPLRGRSFASLCFNIMVALALFSLEKGVNMGKNLKGKEIGKGICQRKDGLYIARFVNRYGNRTVKCFPTVPEARNWLDEARYADSHEDVFVASEMTVDEWFNFWIENIVGDLAPNTRRNYRERYNRNMKPILGRLKLKDVKPLHCKMVLNSMDKDYAGSTIRQLYRHGNNVQISSHERHDQQAPDGWCQVHQTRPCSQ